MLDEQYLRQDVPCGLTRCPLCETNPNCKLELALKGAQADRVMAIDSEDEEGGVATRKTIDKIFIIDHHFASRIAMYSPTSSSLTPYSSTSIK